MTAHLDRQLEEWERGGPLPRVPQPRPQPQPTGPRMLTVAGVAPLLGVSKQTTYRLIERGELRARRIGRQLRIDRMDVVRFLEDARTDRQDDEL